MKFNTKKAVIAMFSISVLAIVVLNFGIDSQQQVMETQYLVDTVEIITPDTEKQYEEQLQKRYEERLTKKILEPESIRESEPVMEESIQPPAQPMLSEPQVIVVQMPAQQQGVDWKSLISWAIAALNGVVLLVMNIKNLKKR